MDKHGQSIVDRSAVPDMGGGAWLAFLIDFMRDAVAVVEPGTLSIRHANAAAAEMTGYHSATLRMMSVPPLLPEGERGLLSRTIAHIACEGGSAGPIPGHLLRLDGTLRPVEFSVRAIELPEGRTIAVAARDMRPRVALEKELRESRDELAAILDAVSDGITVLDPAGHLVYANRAAARAASQPSSESLIAQMTGTARTRYAIEDEAGRSLAGTILPGGRPLDGKAPPPVLMRYVDRVTGVERWLSVRATPIMDDAGQVRQVVNVFHDVTASREARQVETAHIRRQQAMLELTRMALLDDRLHDLLDEAARIVAEALEIDVCIIAELTDDNGFFIQAGHTSDPTSLPYRRRLSAPAGTWPVQEYALQHDGPVVCNDLAAETRFDPTTLQTTFGIRSVIATAIPGPKRPFGVLTTASSTPRKFSQAETQFVDSAATMFGAAIDRAARRDELAASEAKYRTIVETANEGIWTIDANHRTTFVNVKMAAMLGYTIDEMAGRSLFDFMDAEGQQIAVVGIERRRQGIAEHVSCKLRRNDGTDLWVGMSTSPQYDSAGTYTGSLAMVTDLSAEREAEYYKRSALHDPLTGLPNRALFDDRLAQAIELAKRRGDRAAVLLVDLDGFKRVNDTHGHHAGDLVLQEIARRLRRGLRVADTAARLGGDEFALVLTSTDRLGAAVVADKLRKRLTAPLYVEGEIVSVGASIGVALYPDHGSTAADLTRSSDSAMYLAKREHTGVHVNMTQEQPLAS